MFARSAEQTGPDFDDSHRLVSNDRIRRTRIGGRRHESRNYRGHHRGLGHHHFGDSDPAADLAQQHREAVGECICYRTDRGRLSRCPLRACKTLNVDISGLSAGSSLRLELDGGVTFQSPTILAGRLEYERE